MLEKSEPITARRYHTTVSRFTVVLQATLSSFALEQWMNDQPAQKLLKFSGLTQVDRRGRRSVRIFRTGRSWRRAL